MINKDQSEMKSLLGTINLDACGGSLRNPTPDLRKFLEDSIDRMEELQYGRAALSNDRYQWMASRFLLFHTDHYMVCG